MDGHILALDGLMDRAKGARALPRGTGVLLTLTSRPLRTGDIRVLRSPLAAGLLSQLRHWGWAIRFMGARNYLIWRNGSFLDRSDHALLVLPTRVPAYSADEWTHICLFETVRRLHQVSFAAGGREGAAVTPDVDARIFAYVRDVLRTHGGGRIRTLGDMQAAVQRSVFAGYAVD